MKGMIDNMNKTEIRRRFICMAVAAIMLVSSANFSMIDALAEDNSDELFTDVVENIDFENYEDGTELSESDLAELGFSLKSQFGGVVPRAVVKDVSYKTSGSSKMLCLEIKKDTPFELKKNINSPERNGVKPIRADVEYIYMHNDTVQDSAKDADKFKKRISYNPFGQISAANKVFTNPAMNAGSLYSNSYITSSGGNGYFSYTVWNRVKYAFDYSADKFSGGFIVDPEREGWGGSFYMKFKETTVDSAIPQTISWKTDRFSELNEDAVSYLYLDNISVKTQYDMPDTITGTASSNADVQIKVYDGDKVYYEKEVTADRNGNYRAPANFKLFGDDAVISVASNGETAVKKAKYAISKSGKKVLDMDNFIKDENSIYFADIKLNGDYSLVCPDGTASIAGAVESVSYNGNADVIAAVYASNGAMKQLEKQQINLNAGSSADFALNLSAQTGDVIKVFCTDSLSDASLLGAAYEIGGNLKKTNYGQKALFNINADKCGFNPVSMSYETNGELAENGYVVITAENNGVKYFNVYSGEPPKIILEDKKSNEGAYSVYIYDKNGRKELPSFEYVSSETYQGYFNILNNPNTGLEEFTSVINTPSLKLDTTDYNAADSSARENVLRLFKQYKPGTINKVGQIQDVLDKAYGTVIFVNTVPTTAQIKKYSAIVSNDKAKFDASGLNENVLSDILRILSSKERTEENISSVLSDAFIAGVVKNAASAAETEKYISVDFADYIKANTNVISKLGIDKNDVYSYIVSKQADIASASDIKKLFDEAVTYAQNNTSKSEISINSVKFLDKNEKEFSSLGEYLGKIKCNVNYSAPVGKELYIVLAYYQNDKLLNSQMKKIITDESGEYTTELMDVSAKDGKGVYKVEAKFYSSLSSLTSCTDKEYSVSENVYTNVLDVLGYDFGGFEQGQDDGWRISKMWYRLEHIGASEPEISLVNNISGENENVRSGKYAAKIVTHANQDGIMIYDTVSGPTVSKDDFKPEWVPGEKGVLGYLRDSGAGQYRLSAYFKSGINSNMRLAVNQQAYRTYGQKFQTSVTVYAPKGEWTKAVTEFKLSEATLNNMIAFSVNVSADTCLDDNGNETDFVSQTYYVDDIKLEKIDEDVTDESSNYSVCGTAEANSTVELMVVRKDAYDNNAVTNNDIEYIGSTAADEKGNFSFDVNFNKNAAEYIAVVKCGGKSYRRDMNYALDNNGRKYIELGYFDISSPDGAYIQNISISGRDTLYSNMTLPSGSTEFNIPVYSIDRNGTAILIAAIFNSKGEFKNAYTDEKALTAGTESNFTITANTESGDIARIFLIDGTDNMNILGNSYEIATGLSEFKTAGSQTEASGVSTVFSPSTLCAKVKANISKDGYVTVLAVDKDAAKSLSDIKYADFCKTDASSCILAMLKPEENDTNNNKEFDIYIGNGNVTDKQSFVYKKSSSYQSEYDKLNNNPSTATVESVLKNQELDIDLSKLNSLSGKYYTRALELFIEFKPNPITSVIQIQSTIDMAAETVLASTAPTADMLAEMGEKLGLNAELLAEFKSSAVTDAVRNDTAENMKKNIPSTITKASLNSQFESAYIAAYIKNMSKKYQDTQSFATDKFDSYIKLDKTKPSANNLSMADVFKTVYKSISQITSIAGLTKLYNDASSVKKSQPSGGSPSGGSPSTGSVPSGVIRPSDNTQKSDIFVDVKADFWAAAAILKLKNKGVISEAEYFRPNDNVSREEFVKMISVGFGLKANGSSETFSDVNSGAWYAEFVKAAADNGVIGGIGNNLFGIGQPITRQDAAAIVGRLIADKLTEKKTGSFTDENEIADYAKEAVSGLSAVKIINGYEDGTFCPHNYLTRAECAKILAAVFELAK